MSDGAHQGITAGRALRTILGGEPPPAEDEGMDAETMEAWIMAAPEPAGITEVSDDGYTDAARTAAKIVLVHLKAHPEDARLPVEAVYQWTEDGRNFVYDINGKPIKLQTSLWDKLYELYGADLHLLGLTGFQAGWAMNAARRCLEVPPVSNPALMTIGEKATEVRA